VTSLSATSSAEIPRRSIVLLATAAFASAATTRITDSVLPQIADEFDVSIAAVAIVASVYTFAYGSFQALFGPVGDRFGKYRIVLFICMASVVTATACGLSGSFNGIIFARLISGMTSAAIIPLSMAWIGDVVDYEERQPILARFMFGQVLGVLAGQIGGGILGEYFGWRASFFVLAGVFAVVSLGLIYELRTNPLAAERPTPVHTSWLKTWAATARLVLIPRVRFVLVVVALEGFAVFGAFTYVGLHLRNRFGFDFGTVGLYLAVFAAGATAYVLFSRQFLNLLGQGKMSLLGTIFIGGGLIVIGFAPQAQWSLPAIALIGMGYYMIHNTLQTLATQMVPEARGAAVALFATSFYVSQAAGVVVCGFLIDRIGIPAMFTLMAALAVFVGLIMLTRIRHASQ